MDLRLHTNKTPGHKVIRATGYIILPAQDGSLLKKYLQPMMACGGGRTARRRDERHDPDRRDDIEHDGDHGTRGLFALRRQDAKYHEGLERVRRR